MRLFVLFLAAIYCLTSTPTEGYLLRSPPGRQGCSRLFLSQDVELEQSEKFSRRKFVEVAGSSLSLLPLFLNPNGAEAEDNFRPARRPTAYRVDSTQPPTLLPLATARDQRKVLADIARGSGTPKEAIVDDRVNLNNILNKAVFGTIEKIKAAVPKDNVDDSPVSSFVCLGMPDETKPLDVDLALSLTESMIRTRDTAKTAIGLHFVPRKAQADLDSFLKSGNEQVLIESLQKHGITDGELVSYMPIIKLANANSIQLLALKPDQNFNDLCSQGIPGNLWGELMEEESFFGMLQDPQYRLYVERSLIKDFPADKTISSQNYVLARAFSHATAAAAASSYAVANPGSLVILIAPTKDLRYLRGINGQIPRSSSFLSQQQSKITDDLVTTILLNPTSRETLSKTNYLRLEIGTGPQTLDFQLKVADYLWFSVSPRVNSIPRLMNG